MHIRTAGTGVGLAASVGAGAAMILWPYALTAQIVMFGAIFILFVTIGWYLVELFFARLPPIFKILTVLVCGMILGGYSGLAGAYFSGYLADAYPKTQKQMADLTRENVRLVGEVEGLQKRLRISEGALTDAKKILSDPLSVEAPSYSLKTALRLQFNKKGEPKEIESNNVAWKFSLIPVAKESYHDDSPSPVSVGECPAARRCLNDPVGLSNLYTSPFQANQQIKPSCKCPAISRFSMQDSMLFIFSFLRPVSVKDIRLDSYGAELPAYKIIESSNRWAVLSFDRAPTNVAVERVFALTTD